MFFIYLYCTIHDTFPVRRPAESGYPLVTFADVPMLPTEG